LRHSGSGLLRRATSAAIQRSHGFTEIALCTLRHCIRRNVIRRVAIDVLSAVLKGDSDVACHRSPVADGRLPRRATRRDRLRRLGLLLRGSARLWLRQHSNLHHAIFCSLPRSIALCSGQFFISNVTKPFLNKVAVWV
jgi:hypothetical protein